MKEFDFFLRKGEVKKQSPDKNLSQATFKESLERLEFSKGIAQKAKPKYTLENAYEAMREAADAILYSEGFKSFSHEASIIYLVKKGFNEQDIMEFDRFRKIRNGIKYYGKDCDASDAKSAIIFAERIIGEITKILKNREPLIWKTKYKEIEINSFKEILDALISIKQESIDEEVNLNTPQLIQWLERNFPEQLDLITSIKESLKESTPGKIRELIIRKLRNLTE